MNKTQLIDAIAKESGTTQAETARVVEGFTNAVRQNGPRALNARA